MYVCSNNNNNVFNKITDIKLETNAHHLILLTHLQLVLDQAFFGQNARNFSSNAHCSWSMLFRAMLSRNARSKCWHKMLAQNAHSKYPGTTILKLLMLVNPFLEQFSKIWNSKFWCSIQHYLYSLAFFFCKNMIYVFCNYLHCTCCFALFLVYTT